MTSYETAKAWEKAGQEQGKASSINISLWEVYVKNLLKSVGRIILQFEKVVEAYYRHEFVIQNTFGWLLVGDITSENISRLSSNVWSKTLETDSLLVFYSIKIKWKEVLQWELKLF